MSNPSANKARYQVVWLVRRLFRALGQKSDEMLLDYGISAADRAVMEFLYPRKALAVPEIARKYDVSRQHVQVTVNPLIERGLVETAANPRHQRSPLLRLTTRGRNLFRKILECDQRVLGTLFQGIPDTDSQATCRTLHALLSNLKEGDDHENT